MENKSSRRQQSLFSVPTQRQQGVGGRKSRPQQSLPMVLATRLVLVIAPFLFLVRKEFEVAAVITANPNIPCVHPERSRTFLGAGQSVCIEASEVMHFLAPNCSREDLNHIDCSNPCKAGSWIKPVGDKQLKCTAEKFHSYVQVGERLGMPVRDYMFEDPNNPGVEYVIIGLLEGYRKLPHKRAVFCSSAPSLSATATWVSLWTSILSIAFSVFFVSP